MDKLSYLENYLLVLDQASFSAAARIRGVSQPAISQQMSALEAYYETPLLQRSSTGVLPTRAGSVVARHAQILLEDHRMMKAELSALDTSTTGELRISTSQFFSHSLIGERIQALGMEYPGLKLILKAEDRMVDVVREGYDLAIRSGTLGNSDGIARKFALIEMTIVASPEYLDRVGRPQHHSDLLKLSHIQYSEHRNTGFLPLMCNGREVQAEVINGLSADAPQLIMSALENGYGFSRIPVLMSSELERQGKLERVLPHYDVTPKDLYLVYPHRHAIRASTKLVISALRDAIVEMGGIKLLEPLGMAAAE